MRKMKFSSVDDNFMLHGSSKPFIDRPEYFNNTELTISRRNSPKVYNPLRYSGLSRSSSASNLKKSVSFSENELKSALADYQVKNSMDTVDREVLQLLNEPLTTTRPISSSMICPISPAQAEWFTKPIHLNPVQSTFEPTRSKSPINRPIGYHGADIAASHFTPIDGATHEIRPDFKSLNNMTEMDRLANIYFPVTIKSDEIIDNTVVTNKTISGPGKGLPEPGAPWRPLTPSNKKQLKSTFNISKKKLSDLEKMYLMSKTAPVIKSSTVSLPSPYHYEIAKLRMERLRIEEEHLLEVKRIRELERTRGPQPKWYELKGPTFHYEAHKNNELIRSEPDWQELLNYRQQLINSSQQY